MMHHKVILSLLAGVVVLVGVLWFRQAGSSDLFLPALAWTSNATPAAGPGTGPGSTSPSDTLAAFGLSGPATCRSNEPPTHSPWLAVAHADAQKYQLDPLVFDWKIWQESGFNPDVRDSPAGAIGIAQFEPVTARALGIDPRDPEQALDASARLDVGHLKNYADRARLLASHYGGWSARYGYALALAAYNAGPGALESAWNRAYAGGWPSGPWAWLTQMAGETQRYIPNILNCPTS